ncbi:unnamed protein product [Amoebophrya sp. A25]|nr:unnamed protein product [Amoebophrya sp. A25]|eukprot:GSA25T00017414001.1
MMDLGNLLAAAQRKPMGMDDLRRAGDDFGKLKGVGNECFKERNYELAIKAYTRAAKAAANDVDRGTIASNTAMAMLQIGQFEEALKQAEVAIKHRPDWEKAYLRKVVALIGLEKADDAEAVLNDTTVFPKDTEETTALREQVVVARLPWIEAQPNVWVKYITGKRPDDSLLEDLDIVWTHYRVLDRKSREVLHSTRWSFPVPGLASPGESAEAQPESITLAEYNCEDVVDMILRRLEDGGEAFVKITGPCSFYPDVAGDASSSSTAGGDGSANDKTLGPNETAGGSSSSGAGGAAASRPQLEFQVTLYKHEKSPKEPTGGLKDVAFDVRRGDRFLKGALDGKEKLDTFDRSKANADQSKDQALEVAWGAKKGGFLAVRRFRRALDFLDRLKKGDEELANSTEFRKLSDSAKLGLSRSLVVAQHVFGVEKADQGDFGRDLVHFLEKKGHKSAAEAGVSERDLEEALELADSAIQAAMTANGEEKGEQSKAPVELHVAKAEALNALGRLDEALAAIEVGFKSDPKSELLRSERARINLKVKKNEFEDKGVIVENMKAELDKHVVDCQDDATRDFVLIRKTMLTLGEMCDNNEIAWDALMKIKIGKTIGLVQKAAWAGAVGDIEKKQLVEKPGDLEVGEIEEVATLNSLATKLIRKFRDMAERNRPLWA